MDPSGENGITTCKVCNAPADFFALEHFDHIDHFCSWTCIMVFAAEKERTHRLYLVSLAEKRSSKLRQALIQVATTDPAAEAAVNQLDDILMAIRAGA
jgi:hypothetical protein